MSLRGGEMGTCKPGGSVPIEEQLKKFQVRRDQLVLPMVYQQEGRLDLKQDL